MQPGPEYNRGTLGALQALNQILLESPVGAKATSHKLDRVQAITYKIL